MRWKGRQRSRNVEDQRSRRGVSGKRVGGGLGILGIVAAIVIYLAGGDPSALLNSGGGSSSPPSNSRNTTSPKTSAKEDELADFVSVVLKDTEDAWHKIFKEQVKGSYSEPKMRLFKGTVQSACGMADAATGPFYCPGDHRLYIDLVFSDELKHKYGANGDFALAYVIAHEVGHHVQNLLGTLSDVQQKKRSLSKSGQNALQVRVELQADFYAGVWARYAQEMKGILESGDLEEAMAAAAAVGDDRLQKRARGYVVPESFTHGTSAQRKRWFKKGYNSGLMKDGDTFSARRL